MKSTPIRESRLRRRSLLPLSTTATCLTLHLALQRNAELLATCVMSLQLVAILALTALFPATPAPILAFLSSSLLAAGLVRARPATTLAPATASSSGLRALLASLVARADASDAGSLAALAAVLGEARPSPPMPPPCLLPALSSAKRRPQHTCCMTHLPWWYYSTRPSSVAPHLLHPRPHHPNPPLPPPLHPPPGHRQGGRGVSGKPPHGYTPGHGAVGVLPGSAVSHAGACRGNWGCDGC